MTKLLYGVSISLHMDDLYHVIHVVECTWTRKSKASASEFLENLEKMCLRYYMHSDMLTMFQSLTTL